MATVDDLRGYVGASVSDNAFLQDCLDTATALVDAYVGSNLIPDAVLENAYLQVGSEIYNRRSAPSGIAQFAAFDGAPVRVARDPMTSTYPMLNLFMVGAV